MFLTKLNKSGFDWLPADTRNQLVYEINKLFMSYIDQGLTIAKAEKQVCLDLNINYNVVIDNIKYRSIKHKKRDFK